MATVLETLLATLDADTRPMRRALSQAEGDLSNYERNVDKFLGKSEKRYIAAGQKMEAALKRVGAAVLAAISVDAAANAVTEVAALQKLSDQAGLTTDRFQELKFAFSSTGLEQERLGQAMSDFARNVQEVKNQHGDYYEFLKTTLPTVLEQVKVAQSQSDAFDVVAEAMRRLSSEQARLQLAQKTFGEAGSLMVTVLKGGAAGLAEATQKARENGLIIGGDSVEAAKKATTAYRELSTQLDVEFKRALVNVLPFLTDLFNKINSEIDAINRFSAAMRQAGEATNARANPEATNSTKALDGAIENVTRQLQAQHDALNTSTTLWDKAKNSFFDTEKQAQKLEVELYNLLQRKKELTAKPVTLGEWKVDVNADVLNPRVKPNYTGVDALAEAAKTRADAEQEAFLSISKTYEQELERFRRLLEEKEITEAQYAKARADIVAANSARVMEAIKKERDAIAQQLQPFRDVIEQSLTDPLRDAFDGNLKSMNEYFRQLVANMALAIQKTLVLKPLLDGIQNSISGPGGYTGFLNAIGLKGFGQSTMDLGQINGWQTDVTSSGNGLSNLFAGFRADGGPVVPGMSYNVGEHGVEKFVPTVPGYIVPNGASGGSNVTQINVDARGSDISVAERTERAVQAAARTMQDPVQAQRAVAKRFPYRKG